MQTEPPRSRADFQRQAPPRWRDKMARLFWRVIEASVFRLSPTPFHAWRRLLLTMFGAEIGRAVKIYPGVTVWAPWRLRIMDRATVGPGVIIYNVGEVEVGVGAIVSQRAHLCAATHNHNSSTFDLMCAPIIIADNAWVAAEAFIGPGVHIRQSAVVAARSVVVRDVEASHVVAGNPARVIAERSQSGRNFLA